MQKAGKIFLRILLISLFISEATSQLVFAQTIDNSSIKKDSASKPITSNYSPSTNDSPQQPLVIQPIVRVGIGMLSYIGNVKNNSGSYIQNPSEGRIGYDLGIAQPLSPVTEFSLNFLYGSVAEAEQIPNAYWNFQSTIAGGGINVLFKILPKQQVTPYFIIGVESYEFISKADIYDQNGNQYYSWSDGTVRSLPQSSAYASTAKILNLDYSYGTDIRGLNLDGSGTYTQQTFAIPVGVGFMFRIATKVDFMLGTTLHYTFTDHIDGLTPQVQGTLKGTLSNDMFVYTYASLRFNLTRSHPKRIRDKTHDEYLNDPSLLQDTVRPDVPKPVDTSLATIEMQYERYMDTTGKYGVIHQVDSFHWQDKNWIGVGPAPMASTTANNTSVTPVPENSTLENTAAATNNTSGTPDNSAANNTTTPTNNTNNTPDNSANNTTTTPTTNNTPITPDNTANIANSTNANSGTIVYKVQLLSSQNKLAEGITFAGISDKASVDQENGMYKYTTGSFTQYSDAQKYLDQLKAIGYTDAFIRATQNGKSVPVPEHQGGQEVANTTNSVVANTNSATTTPANMTGTATGLVFKIQLGAFSNSPDQSFMNMFRKLPNGTIVKDNAGLSHYLSGAYNDLQSATAARDKAKADGVNTVIKAIYNGQFISISEAMNVLKK